MRQLKQYGMGQDDLDKLLAAQDHRCQLCRKPFTKARPAAVDHDHYTGLVRGLLCRPCNYTLGQLHDKADWLYRASRHIIDPIAPRVIGRRYHEDAPPRQEND